MNDIDQKWWDIIKQPGSAQLPGGQQGIGSPLMDYMSAGGLDRWMQNPRVPGSGGTQAPPPFTPPPQAPQAAPMGDGWMTPTQILQNGGGLHPAYGQISLNPHELPPNAGNGKPPLGWESDDAFLRYLMQQKGMSPYGDTAAGVSGVSGGGPDGDAEAGI